jgi:hypothetical protein
MKCFCQRCSGKVLVSIERLPDSLMNEVRCYECGSLLGYFKQGKTFPGECREKNQRTRQMELFQSKENESETARLKRYFDGVRAGERNTACAAMAEYYLSQFCMDAERTRHYLYKWNGNNKPPMTNKEIEDVLAAKLKEALDNPHDVRVRGGE